MSLKLASYLKEKYNCLIVFGGPSCPHNPTDYFKKHKFIDVAIRSEGEDAFNGILQNYLSNKKIFLKYQMLLLEMYLQKMYNNTNKITFNRSLDEYPSPYLTGEFDYLVDNKDEGEFHAIIETNRGCPFLAHIATGKRWFKYKV